MNNNKMVCDLETGVCGEVGEEEMEIIDLNNPKKRLNLYHVTDPICSHSGCTRISNNHHRK